MNFKEILELIDKVSKSGISALEIEQAGTRIRIEGKSSQPHVIHSVVSDARTTPAAPPALPSPAPQPALSGVEGAHTDSEEAGLHIITSPIVGTFYRAANPESDPFVSVGDRVAKGKVLCIVEAMKLMNEIESDVEGTLAKVYPQNGQPIEYGEKLFAVRT